MKNRGEFIMTFLLAALISLACSAGAVAAGTSCNAYLALCRIELLSGEVVDGFVHIGTACGPSHYYSETNGILIIDDNGRLTRLGFVASDTDGLRRNSILEINMLRSGFTDTYIAPSTYGWTDGCKIYFMKDISLRDGDNRIQKYSVTYDTLNGTGDLTYEYSENVTDRFILFDYFPVFTALPGSFENGDFVGGTLRSIEFGMMQEFRLRYCESVSDAVELLKDEFDYEWSEGDEEHHLRFVITLDQWNSLRSRNFKPSWVYDESWTK
jgi:hypothetical protein